MNINANKKPGVISVLREALPRAIQWRLWALWAASAGLCSLLGALPLWRWMGDKLDHSLHAPAIAAGEAPLLLIEALAFSNNPPSAAPAMGAAVLMLLLSPWLAGATVTASRARVSLGFGELLGGGLHEYGPMLRTLLWSVVPLGAAMLALAAFSGIATQAGEQAVLASEAERPVRIALAAGGLLLLLAHASVEAGRGWLAADGRLRSAIKAWWRGLKLLLERPVAVLATYLVPTLLSLLAAALLLALRQRIDAAGFGGFLLAGLCGVGIALALAWGRIARLFGMKTLAAARHARRLG